MNELALLNPVIIPGIALLVLSTTMRAGNIRIAIFEISKSLNTNLDDSVAFEIHMKRLDLLVRSLQQLYLSLLLFISGSAASYLIENIFGIGMQALALTTLIAFIFVFLAVLKLFRESKLTYTSTKLAAYELSRLTNRPSE